VSLPIAFVPGLVDVIEEYKRLRDENAKLKREVMMKDRALHDRNRQLDAMAWVWCDGGCPTGVGRFSGLEVDEAMVCMVETNAKRLRRWYKSKLMRATRS